MSNKKDEKMVVAATDVKDGVEKSVKGIKKILQEFKDFAMRGNMIDMAVGIVLGSAFTGMVNAIVDGILTPLVAYFSTGADFDGLKWHGIDFGLAINAFIHFIIVAAVIFAVVKGMNALSNIKKKDEDESSAEALVTEVEVLQEIRDLLKEKSPEVK